MTSDSIKMESSRKIIDHAVGEINNYSNNGVLGTPIADKWTALRREFKILKYKNTNFSNRLEGTPIANKWVELREEFNILEFKEIDKDSINLYLAEIDEIYPTPPCQDELNSFKVISNIYDGISANKNVKESCEREANRVWPNGSFRLKWTGLRPEMKKMNKIEENVVQKKSHEISETVYTEKTEILEFCKKEIKEKWGI